MSANAVTPLFDFLQEQMDTAWTRFVSHAISEYGNSFHEQNKKLGQLSYLHADENGITVDSKVYFLANDNRWKSRIQGLIVEVKKYHFDHFVESDLRTNFNSFIESELYALENRIREYGFDFLADSLVPVFHVLKHTKPSGTKLNNATSGKIVGFPLITINDSPEVKARKLYNLFIESSENFIETDVDNFTAVFTGQLPINRIKWISMGKNGSYSKASLFYFIDLLILDGHLSSDFSNNSKLYPALRNCFSDPQGSALKNLAQSRSSNSMSPEGAKELKRIISEL